MIDNTQLQLDPNQRSRVGLLWQKKEDLSEYLVMMKAVLTFLLLFVFFNVGKLLRQYSSTVNFPLLLVYFVNRTSCILGAKSVYLLTMQTYSFIVGRSKSCLRSIDWPFRTAFFSQSFAVFPLATYQFLLKFILSRGSLQSDCRHRYLRAMWDE